MARNARYLMLGCSHSELPIIKKLSEYPNVEIITCGLVASPLCKKYIKKHIHKDYSNFTDCLDIYLNESCDYTIAGCNDFAEFTKSYIDDHIYNNGSENNQNITRLLHHKHNYRKNLSSLFPDKYPFITVNAADTNENKKIVSINFFPCIVKPIDLSGGKGVTKVTDKKDLKESIEHAQKITRCDQILIEKFYEGTNHAHSCFLKNGAIYFEFIDTERHEQNPYSVSAAYGYHHLSSHQLTDLRNQILSLSSRLGIYNGFLHTQFILSNDSNVYLLETTRRCPGDLYPLLVEHSCPHFDYIENYILHSVNKTKGINRLQRQQTHVVSKLCLRQVIYIEEHANKWAVSESWLDEYIISQFILSDYNDPQYKDDKVAIRIYQFTNQALLLDAVNAAHSLSRAIKIL